MTIRTPAKLVPRIAPPLALLLLALTSLISAQDLETIGTAKPFTLSGGFNLKTGLYGCEGSPSRQDPFTYGIDANATLDFYGVSMPFSFSYYDGNKSYTHPFNQFGLSPKYKWITGHFGYRSVTFSEFTLNGKTFLGAGLELIPGKWRLGGLYGKFNDKGEDDALKAQGLKPLSRKGWAAKVGYGFKNASLDLSLLRIADDDADYDPIIDTAGPAPEQNFATSVHGKLNLNDNLVFETEGAVSVLTTNAKAQSLSGDKPGWLSFGSGFIDINESSEYYKALKANLKWKINRRFVSGIEYRRIDPGYKTMGAYYFTNDLQNININQTALLYQNKINLRGSFGLQNDNLANNKKTTSNRTVGSINASYQINTKFGLDAGFSNFTTSQKSGTVPLIDSLKLNQVNKNITIAPRFVVANEKFSHAVILMSNFMVLNDMNKKTRAATETNTSIYNLTYALGLLPQKANLSASLNYTALDNALAKSNISGITAGVNKTMASDKLNLGWTNSFMINRVNNDDGTVFSSNATAGYRFSEHQTLNLNLYYSSNSFEKGSLSPSTKEYKGDLNYGYTF